MRDGTQAEKEHSEKKVAEKEALRAELQASGAGNVFPEWGQAHLHLGQGRVSDDLDDPRNAAYVFGKSWEIAGKTWLEACSVERALA